MSSKSVTIDERGEQFADDTAKFLWNVSTKFARTCRFMSAQCIKDLEASLPDKALPQKLQKFFCEQCKSWSVLGETASLLVEKQKKRKRKSSKRLNNRTQRSKKPLQRNSLQMTIVCRICKNRSKTLVPKDQLLSTTISVSTSIAPPTMMMMNESTVKKKRKKRTIDAGLLLPNCSTPAGSLDESRAPSSVNSSFAPSPFAMTPVVKYAISTTPSSKKRKLTKLQMMLAQQEEKQKSLSGDLSSFLVSMSK